MSSADFCTLIEQCAGATDFTPYANMGACVTAYGGLSAATRMCRSYHLCNALGAGGKNTHCKHAIGVMLCTGT
jgi:hypothetical protein